MSKDKPSLADIAEAVSELDEEEMERKYVVTEAGHTALAEAYWRAKIADEIQSIDIYEEAKAISPDWYAATIRMRTVCAAVARKGLQ